MRFSPATLAKDKLYFALTMSPWNLGQWWILTMENMKYAPTQYVILHHSETNFIAILTFRFAAVKKKASFTSNLSKAGTVTRQQPNFQKNFLKM